MARHEYSPEHDGSYSAEIFRLQCERKRQEERRREVQKELNEYKKPAEQAAHAAERMVERQVRKAVTSDPIANEIRDANIYGGLVFNVAAGLAISVAAAAMDASHARAMERAREEFTEQQHADIDRAYNNEKREEQRTLSEYKNDVAERTMLLEENKTTYYNEYKSISDSAKANIETANSEYEKQSKEYSRLESRADRDAKSGYEHADSVYASRVDEINRTLPESKRADAIREAERERTASYDAVRQAHTDSIESINKSKDEALLRRDSIVGSENKRIDEAKETFAREVKEQRANLTGAEERLAIHEQKIIERDNHASKDAVSQVKREDGYASRYDAARHLSDDQIRLIDKAEADETAKKLAKKTGVPYESTVTAEERSMAHELTRNQHFHEKDLASSHELMSAINKSHNATGAALAATLATGKDKELLDKVANDRIAADQARKEGKEYLSNVTEAEKAQARAIEKQYAGSISSEKDIKRSVAQLNNNIARVEEKIRDADGELKKCRETSKQIDKQLGEKRQVLSDINSANKMLRSGKDENNNPLSAAKRTQLEERIKSNPSISALQKDINALQLGKNKALDAENKAIRDLANLKAVKKGAQQDVATLSKHGKLIADTAFDITKATTFKGAVKGLREESKRNSAIKRSAALEKFGNKLRDNHGGVVKAAGAVTAFGARKTLEKNQKQLNKKDKSKKSEKASKAAAKAFNRSMGSIQREFNKAAHKGNAVHKEIFGTARTLSRIAQKYELALSVGALGLKVIKMPAAFSVRCMGKAFRHIGGENSRLGKKLRNSKMGKALAQKRAAKLQWQKNHARFTKFSKNATHLTKLGVKGFGKSVVRAPIKILKAPKAVIGALTDPSILAKKAALGSFRLVRKTGGRVLKLTGKATKLGGKLGKKAWAKTIGKSRMWKKHLAKKRLRRIQHNQFMRKLASTRIGRFFGGLRMGVLGVGQFFKRIWIKISVAIANFFAAILSAILTAIGYLMLFALGFIVLFMIVLVIVGGLTAVLDAITNWLKGLVASNQKFVNDDPSFILKCAVQYRNAELEILDVMKSAQTSPSNITISADPLYYLITDEDKSDTENPKGQTKPNFNSTSNPKAQSILNNIKNKYNKTFQENGKDVKKWTYTGITTIDTKFDVNTRRYNSVKIQYYDSKYLNKDDQGRLKASLKAGAVPSSYEISNAKDALSIVDSIYTNKADTMEKMEVLAYLGVGATQISDFDDSKKKGESLFWNTHKFIYRSGDSADDVWYHVTEQSGDNYVVNHSLKYVSGGTENANDTCDQQIITTLTYDETIYQYFKKHTSFNDFDDYVYASNNREFLASSAINKQSRSETHWISPSEFYYQLGGNAGSVSYTKNGESKNISIYKLRTNYTSSINSLHKGTQCDRLYFYRGDNWANYFIITDKDGYVVDHVLINPGTALYKLITKVSVNPSDAGTTTIFNSADAYTNGIALDYFWLDWSSSKNKYGFTICSFQESSFYADEANTKETMESSLRYYVADAELSNYKNNITTSNISVSSCSHEVKEPHTTPKSISYAVCGGHIDLDVAVGVASGCMDANDNDNEDIFVAAMYVNKLSQPLQQDSFLGIYTKSSIVDISGWGGVTWTPFDPQSDWKKDTDYRAAAKLKSKNEVTYSAKGTNNEYEQVAHIYSNPSTGVYNRQWFKPMVKLPDDNLGFGFMFQSRKYYQIAMKTGEQKELECYLWNGSEYVPIKIDIAVDVNGRPSIKEH